MPDRTYGNPNKAPDYLLHRDVAAVDTANSDVKTDGMNMAGYRIANIQVVPKAGQNPTTEVMFWSDEADEFIPANTALSFTGLGNDKPYEVSVEANSRIIWVKITVGTAKISISGWELEYR